MDEIFQPIKWRAPDSEKLLEFSAIKKQLVRHAVSPAVKQHLVHLTAFTTIEKVQAVQEQTLAAYEILSAANPPEFAPIVEQTKSLRLAKKGGLLSLEEIRGGGQNLRLARKLKKYLQPFGASSAGHFWRGGRNICLDVFGETAEALYEDKTLEDQITGSFDERGDLIDKLWPDLRAVRKQIKIKSDELRHRAEKILNHKDNAELWQDKVLTMRNGRFTFAVRTEEMRNFPGILHDRSKGGRAVFIEPQELVEQSNELELLRHKENEEIEKIIAALSAALGEVAEDLIINQRHLWFAEFCFAKASFAAEIGATAPEIGTTRTRLLSARHPLLDRQIAVPLSLQFPEGDEQALIISGANAGGKTVALKTIGLLTMMAQAGLFITADSGSEICVYEKIMVDIGDEQSLQQNLSTFSGHLKKVIGFLKSAGNRSLVLLDELMMGTDPREGEALAEALIFALMDRGARVVTTTHYSQLKHKSLSSPKMTAAAMEFDAETLQPTYHLRLGETAASSGLLIARRMGLPSATVSHARSLLATEERDFSALQNELQQKLKEAENNLERSQKIKNEAEIRRDKLMADINKLKHRRQEIIDQTMEKATAKLNEALAEIKAQEKELKKIAQNPTIDNINKIVGLKNKLSTRYKKYRSKQAQSEMELVAGKPVRFEQLKIGDRVMLADYGSFGIVRSLDAKREEATVALGDLTLTVRARDLRV